MLVKNASFLPENTTTLGRSGNETREPEANTGSANTAAMKGSLKSIEDNEKGRKSEKDWGIIIFLTLSLNGSR